MVKVPILNHLEALRDEELEERREKRRKQQAEEDEAKAADKAPDDPEPAESNAQVPPQPFKAYRDRVGRMQEGEHGHHPPPAP